VTGEPSGAAGRVPLRELALLFGRIGLLSFGGGLTAWVHRETVSRRPWLDEKEFLSALMLAQILPGSNVVNLTIYIGRRLRGRVGALVSVVALLAPPMALVVAIAALCASLMADATVHHALEGVAAGAAGMTLSVGVRSLRAAMGGRAWPLVVGAGVVAAIGLMRWPLVPTVAVAALAAFALAWRARTHAR
jgi:chromate transporter